MRESELHSVAHANLLFSFFHPLLWLRCAFLALTLLQTCDYRCTICVCLCFRSSLMSGPDWTELNRNSEMDGMRASHLSILRLTDDRPTDRYLHYLLPTIPKQISVQVQVVLDTTYLPTYSSLHLYTHPLRWRDPFLIFSSHHIPSHSI